MPPTATALCAGGGSRPSKVPATCRRTFSSSSTEGGSRAQVGVGQEAGPDPKRGRPAHRAVRLAHRDLARSRRPRRSPRSSPRRAGRACAWRPRTTVAPPPRPRARRAACRRHRAPRSPGRPRLGALRMAAVATATICSAPTSRATLACVATTSAVSAIFSAGIAPPWPRLLPIRVKARWVTSSRSCPSPASATSSRVVLLPMSMQAQIKCRTAGRARGARRPRTPGTDR